MYKVLIVDDEPLVRIGVKSIIDWESLNLTLIGEVSNGKEALALIEKYRPEIIFLDICMPVMNGIQLLQIMKEKNIHAQVLILSCHNEIEYVKQAIRLGAFDYILKLSLNTENLTRQILNMKDQISEQNGTEYIDPRKSVRIYLHKMVNYIYTTETDDKAVISFKEQLAQNENCLVLVNINMEESQEINIYLNIIDEVLKDSIIDSAKWHDCVLGYNQIFVIFSSLLEDQIKILITKISSALQSYTNFHFYIGVSSLFLGVENVLNAIRQADTALSHSYYAREQNIFYIDHVVPYIKNTLIDTKMEQYIYESIEFGDIKRIYQIINQIFENTIQKHDMHPSIFKSNIIEITNLFIKYLHIIKLSLGDILPKFVDLFQMIIQSKNIVELHEMYNNFINDYFNAIMKTKKEKIRDDIISAKTFIAENFQNQIHLTDVARHVNMSETYLSCIFKKEIGEGYVNYLNQIRIEKAKELFQKGGYKVYEVAEMVGYNNANYFNKVFKKLTGHNPNTVK